MEATGRLSAKARSKLLADSAGAMRVKGSIVKQVSKKITSTTRYIYDAPVARYRDLNTGRFIAQRDLPYPSNAGFAKRTRGKIKPGTIIDRIGKPSGRFASEGGTSASARGLPAGSKALPFKRYRVVKLIEADVGTAARVPQFGAKGGAKQYLFDDSIEELVRRKILKEVK